MEYRKIISFGKSSFVISLPKAWIRNNNVKKGDMVYVSESQNDLIVSSKEFKESEQREITLNIDGKNDLMIKRELNAAYIENNRKITFTGKEIKEKSEIVLESIKELIALEVLEFDSKKIVTKDFLDMDKISPQELIKKIDMINRSMLKDTAETFKDDNAQNINLRDKDVNRLSFLLFRIMRYGLRNQGKMLKNHGLMGVDLLNTYMASYLLEAVADESKRISRAMSKSKIKNKKCKEEFRELIKDTEKFYLGAVKYYFAKNREEALILSDFKVAIVKKVNTFYDEHKDHREETIFVVDRLRRLIGVIHELNRLTYQY